jgi:hypothetical protein
MYRIYNENAKTCNVCNAIGVSLRNFSLSQP